MYNVLLLFYFLIYLAGADVIMTNTYQASINGFVEYLNLSEEESYNLIKSAVDYARIARKRFLKEYPQLSNNIVL